MTLILSLIKSTPSSPCLVIVTNARAQTRSQACAHTDASMRMLELLPRILLALLQSALYDCLSDWPATPYIMKDKGQNRITTGKETSAACMDRSKSSSTAFCISLCSWDCLRRKHHSYLFHVGWKRLTSSHELMAYESKPRLIQYSVCTFCVHLFPGFNHCPWSLIIHSAWYR